uniref:Uncharacterized protein n=1 Tax=Meloidogyne enterolobii TaxID=390850 RepID=A0A6V7VF11_MELEN|nr:unnamed protein product [Meloidogyne enterolobii]
MLFHKFIFTNLLLFFIENLSQSVNGMHHRPSGSRMKSGLPHLREPPNLKNFNIVDLSLLIRILNTIEVNPMNITNMPIRDTFLQIGGGILDIIYNNWQGDQEILLTIQKFNAVSL